MADTREADPAGLASPASPSMAANQMGVALARTFDLPLHEVRKHLKELIGKQNKIYIDLSTEKYNLDNSKSADLMDMMIAVGVYREKLVKIKKKMQDIYQRTAYLKKKSLHMQMAKQKEMQRNLLKQEEEASLINVRKRAEAQKMDS